MTDNALGDFLALETGGETFTFPLPAFTDTRIVSHAPGGYGLLHMQLPWTPERIEEWWHAKERQAPRWWHRLIPRRWRPRPPYLGPNRACTADVTGSFVHVSPDVEGLFLTAHREPSVDDDRFVQSIVDTSSAGWAGLGRGIYAITKPIVIGDDQSLRGVSDE